ncbi:MAG: hypothetical protein ACRCXB_07495 [Aeromonadaceae bacterium]
MLRKRKLALRKRAASRWPNHRSPLSLNKRKVRRRRHVLFSVINQG